MVGLFPSHEEGYGMALAETIQAGVASVAWNLPAYEEHFRRGVITIPEGDVDSFAATVVRLLDDASFRDDILRPTPETATASRTWAAVAAVEWELITEACRR